MGPGDLAEAAVTALGLVYAVVLAVGLVARYRSHRARRQEAAARTAVDRALRDRARAHRHTPSAPTSSRIVIKPQKSDQ